MNKARLIKGAEILEADAKKKNGIQFDLGTWGRVNDETKPVSCATKACAMGLFALSGAFKRAGLTAEINMAGRIHFRWQGEYMDGVAAAARLFAIDRSTAARLFLPNDGYECFEGAKAEREVAKAMRSVAAGKAPFK